LIDRVDLRRYILSRTEPAFRLGGAVLRVVAKA